MANGFVNTGYEGQGPEVDLPELDLGASGEALAPMNADGSLQVTVTPAQAKPAANPQGTKIQEALSQGVGRAELSGYLQQNMGLSEAEADLQLVESVQDKVKQAKELGVSDDEIKSYLIENRYDSSVVDSAIQRTKLSDKVAKIRKFDFDPNTPAEEAQDISDLYNNVYGKYSTLGKQLGGVFSEDMGREARQTVNQLNASIASKMAEDGFNTYIEPTNGMLMLKNEDGSVQEVDTSFLNSIYNSKAEFAGALSLGMAGAALGSKAPGAMKPIATVAGAVGGSMVGASTGKAIDMTINASILKEDLEAKLYKEQMIEAGIFDGIAGIVGAGIFKTGVAGFRASAKAYDFVLAGNPKGAYKALLDNLQITDAQAKEIVAQWEQSTQKELTRVTNKGLNKATFGLVPTGNKALSPEEKAIAIVAGTQQGAESMVGTVAKANPKLATNVIKDVDTRAKNLNQLINSAWDNNTGSMVRNDLANYQKDVKDFYGQVKAQGAEAINGTDFRFDLDKLTIKPVMENIAKKVSNPMMRENFLSYAARIESASNVRTFEGLIDLRQAVNDFKYSKSGLSTPDLEALNSVLNKIDGQIGKAVKDYMPDTGKDWLDNFATAKKEYSKMKQLEENALFKMIDNNKATESQLQKALSKYATDTDVDVEIFNKVVERLSPKTRAKVEVAAIKNMTNKFTAGRSTESQAINFPALAENLKQLNITTTEGKYIAGVVEDMAKVFKNDISLSSVSGNIAIPKFAASLGADLTQKARYAIIGEIWQTMQEFVPGKVGNNKALLKKVEKLLEDPLHRDTSEAVIKAMPREMQDEMRSLVKELQIQTAKNPVKKSDRLNMYKQTATGKMTVTDGALGKGVYLVDKVKNPNPASKVIKHEVNLSRMATLDDISNLVGRTVTEKDLRTLPDLNKQLIDKGFLGIRTEGKAMLFPENTLGVKTPASIPADLSKELSQGRVVSRYSKFKETADTINPTRTDFHYVTDNQDILSAYKSVGDIRNDFIAPKNAKILDLSDPDTADKVFNDLFGNKLTGTSLDLEDLMFRLHEGALNKQEPGWTEKLKDYMKKNGYSAHSFNGEEAWLPGVLKDKTPASIPTNLAKTSKELTAEQKGKTFYRGVDGDYPDKEFTFWTDRKDQAEAYSKGAALTNEGKNPKVLERVMAEGKGKNINDAIEEAIMEGEDPDEIAKQIIIKEKLDWVEYYHPSTSGEDHLVRVVRSKKKPRE